jgi:hypothetical protein
MESGVSLPRSQKRTTYPFLGPHYSNARPPIQFLNISFKYILPSITRFYKQSLSIRDLYALLFCSMRATCPVQFAFIWSTEHYPMTSTNHVQFSPVSSYFVPLSPKYLPQYLFSRKVRNQVSYPHKMTGKIVVLYILMLLPADEKTKCVDCTTAGIALPSSALRPCYSNTEIFRRY